MSQAWVPLKALVDGALPSVCLVTGERIEGVTPTSFRLTWAVNPAHRGTTVAGPGGAWVSSGTVERPPLMAALPLSPMGRLRVRSVRPVSFTLVVLALLGPFLAASACRDVPFLGFCGLLVASCIASIAIGVRYGAANGLSLLSAKGDWVLLELPHPNAAAAICQTFGTPDEAKVKAPVETSL